MIEDLASTLCISDLFIGTFSSTVTWAIYYGIPSIIVDFYNLNSDMYMRIENIEIVKVKNKLENVISKKLIEETDFKYDQNLLSKDEVFDGKTVQRYNQVILKNIKG
ncbi:MAG: hypothetical protein VW378_01970 [bacterium]